MIFKLGAVRIYSYLGAIYVINPNLGNVAAMNNMIHYGPSNWSVFQFIKEFDDVMVIVKSSDVHHTCKMKTP